MAMLAGTVAIDADGVTTKSGLAGALYDVCDVVWLVGVHSHPPSLAGSPALKLRQKTAALCNGVALAIVSHIQANAHALVTASDAGLQRMPASTAEDTPTKAPATTQELSIQ